MSAHISRMINEELDGYKKYTELAEEAEKQKLPLWVIDSLEDMADDELDHASKLDKIDGYLEELKRR